jgi:hypothetical protein
MSAHRSGTHPMLMIAHDLRPLDKKTIVKDSTV